MEQVTERYQIVWLLQRQEFGSDVVRLNRILAVHKPQKVRSNGTAALKDENRISSNACSQNISNYI